MGLSPRRAVASLASVGDSRGGISLCWGACADHSGGARYYGSLLEDTDVLNIDHRTSPPKSSSPNRPEIQDTWTKEAGEHLELIPKTARQTSHPRSAKFKASTPTARKESGKGRDK